MPALSTPHQRTHPRPPHPAPPEFRSLMAGHPSGVTVVTAGGRDREPWGMTCSSVCSVTVEPPTLLAGLRAESPTLRAALDTGAFAVNFLHLGGQDTAELFASGAADRFGRVAWELPEDAAGPHLPEAARAVADCRITRTVRVGAQVMVFGQVDSIRDLSDALPLLYGMRRYSAWPPAVPEGPVSGDGS